MNKLHAAHLSLMSKQVREKQTDLGEVPPVATGLYI